MENTLKSRKPKSLRRLFVALGVCLLVILLWPASYFWSDGVRMMGLNHRVEVTTGPGWVAFTYGSDHRNIREPFIQNHFVSIDAGHRSALAYTRIYSSPGDYRFYFPLWMLSLIVAVMAAAMVISDLRRRQNYRPGHCANCGYDLRATPERCPECGAEAGK